VVADVLMPPIGLLLGGIDFSGFAVTLKAAAGSVPAVTLNYGKFIQTVIDFVIIALAIFVMIKAINTFKAKQEAAPVPPPKQEVLLSEIRDILKERK
jgi:large conductance mechanosensitive channel